MSGILYHHCFSAPSRTVLLTVRNLGLNIQVKNVDIFNGEQHSPEYLKINPLNQIPAFVDGNFILTESKAIATYLASSSKSLLYPSDHKKRALIDSKLYFDSTNSFPALRNFYRPVLRSGAKKIDQQSRDELYLVIGKLNSFLEKSEWFAGDELSVADLGFLATVGTIKCLDERFLNGFPKLQAWYLKCKNLPGFAENEEGASSLAERVAELLEEPTWREQ